MVEQPSIVGVRFHKTGKVYQYDASRYRETQPGDFVIVETSRGQQVGEVVEVIKASDQPPEGFWKPIHRPATPRDLVLRHSWQVKEAEVVESCRAKVPEMKIAGVKIVSAEYSFDGSRLTIFYCTETEDKIDLRSLRSAMQRLYPRTNIEMRQIGPRDVAKGMGGMGSCGLANRCCTAFITEFSPISIKMAKEQGISLTPSEITGMCGRLRCCLVYEYEQYVEARKLLPKRGKRVITPQGEGKVLEAFPYKERVLVELDEIGVREFTLAELQPWDETETLRRKSQANCENAEKGCNCSPLQDVPPT